MKTYEEFVKLREDDSQINPSKELKISRGIGNPIGNRLETNSMIISKFRPIVSSVVRSLQNQGIPMREIEEMLEDGLRQTILSVGEKGEKISSPRTKMGTSEFLSKAKKRRQELEPEGDPSVFGQLPDSLERRPGRDDF